MDHELITRDIYLRHTAPSGTSYVKDHRVWDADRFIASAQKAAADANLLQKDGDPRKAKVEQITEEQYRAEQARLKA